MKHVSLLVLATVFSLGLVKAQNQMDAYRFSKNDLTGTARSVSMGGAFGALGGDISGVAINPAGMGLYSSSEIVATVNFQNTESKTASDTKVGGWKLDENKFKVSFDNLAFVTTFPLYNDVAPKLSVGFSYNRLKNFDRKYNMKGDNVRSLTDYMADRAYGNNVPGGSLGIPGGEGMWDVWNNQDWLSVLGYNSGLIVDRGNADFISSTRFKDNPNDGLPAYNDLFVEEKGSISSYDFNIGTMFSDIISVGLTVSLTDINYRMSSSYIEDFLDVDGNQDYWGGYELTNALRTDGTGWQVKAGVIFKPIRELNIGVSYHSPTWYNMTDHFYSDLSHNLNDLKPNSNLFIPSDYRDGTVQSYDGREDAVMDYEIRTPDKWTFSLAGMIGEKLIASADYEVTNYGNMKLFDRNGNKFNADPNPSIKDNFRSASAIRVGLEYPITNQFSARVGYSWVQSPFKSDVKNVVNFEENNGEYVEMTTDGRAVPQFVIDGNTNYFTWGLGYRFTRNFYTDLAFVIRNQKDDLYAFSGANKTSLKTNTFQGMMTLGYRF